MSVIDTLRKEIATIHEERVALITEADEVIETRDGDKEALETRAAEIAARLVELREAESAKQSYLDELVDASERAEAAKAAPIFMRRNTAPTEVADVTRITDGDARARALTFIEESRSFVSDNDKESLTSFVEKRGSVGAAAARLSLVTGSDTYVRAWSKYMSGNSLAITDEERAAFAKGFDAYSPEERAMTSGTGSSGGYFVPIFIDPTMVITGAGSINPLRNISTVKTIGPAQSGWNGVTAAQVTAAWVAEGAEVQDNTPVLTQPNIPVYMAEAFIPVSFQAFEDIADLASDVQALFSDAKANLEATAFTTGSGSSQPTGVVTAVGAVTASRAAISTGGTIGIEDVWTVHSALPARFRGGNLAWISNLAISDRFRRLYMAQNSANSVWTQPDGATPARLVGDPIFEASAMSSTLTTGQDVLLYGDFSRFNIIDRIGFTTEFIPNLFSTSNGRPTASRGWLAHWRTGSNVTDANAFRIARL